MSKKKKIDYDITSRFKFVFSTVPRNIGKDHTSKKMKKLTRVVEPHSFFADPDPAVFFNADPDPAAS